MLILMFVILDKGWEEEEAQGKLRIGRAPLLLLNTKEHFICDGDHSRKTLLWTKTILSTTHCNF